MIYDNDSIDLENTHWILVHIKNEITLNPFDVANVQQSGGE